MRAAVLSQPRTINLQEVDLPQIKPGEVLIRVEGCGVCSSSLPLWEGREWFQYPSEPGSPGHEGWGIVEAVGSDVQKARAGDRVAFLSYHAYADYDVAGEASFITLPKELEGQPFPGEPLGCALNIFERSDVKAGDTVAIIGTGFLGALLCQLAKERGAKVIAVSRRAFSLDYARRFGADEVVPLTSTWETANKIGEITRGAGCSRVIEATGKQEAIDLATEIVAEYGRIIIAGYHQDGLRQVNLQKWNWKAIDVINAHERDPRKYLDGMEAAVAAVVSGRINPATLYTDSLSLEQLNKGFELTANRPEGFMKALIRM
ncbi:Threonine dehydrogenase [Cnuella takakiae]|uniref:Threonine dehydrogenase n=1 Tax=Cnuella takakiae TaxID=1302690 RepID=A0A1M5A460_9BACT|nr:zinc-binding dehydrogenase [Cnuella takakiae]OLY92102.1 L-iditol 2-dehydrogenase [Cnuella takakiae]SHF25061.1 Threonine dehydrogenase [Cnuella takakiae]